METPPKIRQHILSICGSQSHLLENSWGGKQQQNNEVQIAYKSHDNYREQNHNGFDILREAALH